ncbi:hypothetical protein H257_02116 [Aphanomyces astaci]|uniref:Uncharacterized protein n=1 Tax=Aphanomyces astaci TaxID=112090 RepID=W4H5F4_APHAT|nr:hypothetical protein H257_02116 [Aphanomyces astaci]ETV87122.1 hypothetical protein H257_02116 [Aphanomyces astaci]|eukprot:XP_009823921.1 hypothetical protein H257_02116 [Aphanomyces astaci]
MKTVAILMLVATANAAVDPAQQRDQATAGEPIGDLRAAESAKEWRWGGGYWGGGGGGGYWESGKI